MSIAVTVLLFAHLKEKAGAARVEVLLPDAATVADLKAALAQQYPALAEAMPTVIVAVNKSFAYDPDPITPEVELALFPPVSGGSAAPTILRITGEALNLDELLAQITLNASGAACIFTGMVRGETHRGTAHETIALEYEAYQPMAEAKMNQVADEIRARWPEVQGIAIVQRVGLLQPGTPTVLIACTAAHRDTGVFEAARYGIDRLKEIVPVWKKEIGSEGESWVEGDYQPRRGD